MNAQKIYSAAQWKKYKHKLHGHIWDHPHGIKAHRQDQADSPTRHQTHDI